jgi:uncharacterized protein with PIN domain
VRTAETTPRGPDRGATVRCPDCGGELTRLAAGEALVTRARASAETTERRTVACHACGETKTIVIVRRAA